jgi:hypothetical protein
MILDPSRQFQGVFCSLQRLFSIPLLPVSKATINKVIALPGAWVRFFEEEKGQEV